MEFAPRLAERIRFGSKLNTKYRAISIFHIAPLEVSLKTLRQLKELTVDSFNIFVPVRVRLKVG